jgi:hypothetical protein
MVNGGFLIRELSLPAAGPGVQRFETRRHSLGSAMADARTAFLSSFAQTAKKRIATVFMAAPRANGLHLS